MNRQLAKITKVEFETEVLPLIPKNKRGFSSTVSSFEIFICIIHKLKTGSQWSELFIDLESFKPNFSWQLVYYYYRKWTQAGVFEKLFKASLTKRSSVLDTQKLNLDGTHTLSKKSNQGVGYQHRKRGKTSNVLMMTDGKGIPLGIGDIQSGNHHDLYAIVPQFSSMVKTLHQCGIKTDGSILNADKGFDSQSLRRACYRRKILPNVKENKRNRKKTNEVKNDFSMLKCIKKGMSMNDVLLGWIVSEP